MADLRDWFEWNIDFKGQKLSEDLLQIIIAIFAVTAFIVGCYMQSLLVMFGIYGAGVLVSAIVILPPWPFYRKQVIAWCETSKSKADKSG
ncbi:uncharacterized protein VTP21DRAFT_9911 [Calcarisporiella thermophila]|uniref:uncharacterized protein n=1 Tax=Calcarisporiella thermophila TaxID=911321 RepID=UPI003743013F